ncbi:MAG: YitT family protein [Alistipes sp.]|nr:YitT family protein [Alistipes sp.]MBO7263763.1 YitT family protein [Alistipes sp.]
MGVSISSRSILVGIKEYILMTFGMFCYAFGWLMCVLPAGGMGGGAAGLATLINAILPSSVTGFLTIGTLVFIINCVLLILGVMIVGWKFGIKTLYCILMMSVMFNLVESFLEPDLMVNMLKGVDAWRLLLVVLGAASCGVGIAVSFMQGGSTGGTDIVAMIINKFRTVSYGKVLLMTDCGILISSVFLTTVVTVANSADVIELTTIEPLSSLAFARMIYGFIMIAVIGYTVDFVQSGNQQSNQIMIFCKDYEAMADMINTKAHRGATLIDAMGWYTKTPSKAVMVVCRKRDTSMILKLVREQDPSAFLTVGSVMGVYGQGFDALNKL